MTPSRLAPRQHQAEALADLARTFAVHDRAQLISACGTGKTLTARWHAEESGARQVLVLVPSLALLAQTLREWRRCPTWPFEALVVCSDPTTSAGAAERAGDDDIAVDVDWPMWANARARVTVNPRVAAHFLRHARPDRPQVVFSTYHSAPVVAAAQASAGAVFDLAVCDEAHRLAGSPREEFRTVLNPRSIVALRRLFMTATPRTSGAVDAYSMDDPTIFGVVAHTNSFGAAIRGGLLTDYQVLVVAGGAGERADKTRAPEAIPASLFDAVDRHGTRRILSFHGRVASAARFAEAIDGAITPAGHRIRARHISGAMPTDRRSRDLVWLGDDDPAEVRVVTNARVLAEGVDVPAVDAVCFADTKTSIVDIIQAVGRVLRPSAGKQIGTIIIPVRVPAGADDDTELMLSAFGPVWSVLRGLRAHDQRFARDVDTALRAQVRHGRCGFRPAQIHFAIPAGLDETQLQLRMVQEVGDAWARYYAATQDWAWRHAGKRLPRLTQHLSVGVGEWAVRQRSAHAKGVLPAERARELERIPGWFWDLADAAWDDTYAILRAFAAGHGSVAEADGAHSVFAGLRAGGPSRERLGTWLARQRQAFRDGTLDPARAAAMEALPGWTWHPVATEDLAMVDALRQYVDFEKTADVPPGHYEDGLALGRWVLEIRRRKLTGDLHPALEDEIWAATPSRWSTGHRVRWQWDKPETQWRLAYSMLCQFTRREGHAAPATTHRERLRDTQVNLGQWVALQRFERRRGRLDPVRGELLERLPGWRWDGDVGGTVASEAPLDLPSHVRHGSAGAIQRKCRCVTCLSARRLRERHWLAGRREAAMAGGVPAGPARRKLAALEQTLGAIISAEMRERTVRQGAGRTLVAAASGVPLGVLRQLGAGALQVIRPEYETRLLATTADACLSHRRTGTRGRSASAGSTRIDAAPTWVIIHDLERRGFSCGWIGRELGYARRLQLGPEFVTRRVAEQVRELAGRVGDLTIPPGPKNRTVPSLAELLAIEEVA